MKQSYFGKYGRQLSCLLGLLGLAAPRAQAQVASAIYYTQGSSTAALDAVKSVAATGAGGATTLPAGATALSQPTDIVVDRASGYLYVADQYVGTGAIWRYNLNGTGQTRVVAATAGVTYNGLALDAANGRLYFTQAGSTASQAALKAVSLGGALPATATTVATLPTTFTRPGDLALDAAAGVLYIADQRTAGSIIRVAIGSGAVTTLVAGVANANYNGLALDAANGRLYFTQGSADATLDALKLVTLSTSAVTTLASGSTNFTQPTDLAFEPGAGQLYLTDQYVSTGPLLRYTVGVSNGTVSVSNRTALVSATTGAAYGGLALALGTAAPVLTASTGAVTAPEQVTTAIDPGLTLTDPDSPTLTSATVSISSGLVSAEDLLLFVANTATTGNIAGSYNAGTGVLTLSSAGGTATLAQWQAALRSVAYRNSSSAPTTAARTISFVVNDGSQNSNAATRTLNVQAVNDAPVNTVPAGISTPFNTDVAFTGANAITVADVDAGSSSITTTLTSTNGTLLRSGSPAGSTVTIFGPVSSVSNTLTQLSFRPTPGFSGTATVTVLTNDNGNTGTGGALTANSTINITVAAAPALTTTLSTTSASPTSTAPIPFSVTFSRSVGTSFTASDVTVSNGFITSGSFSGSGAGPYTFTVTPFGSSTVTVGVLAGVATDANGTANTASNLVGVQYNQPVTATPVLTQPANNSFVRTNRPEYRGTAVAGSLINIFRATGSGSFALTDTTFANAIGNFHRFAALADGQYSVFVTATASGRATSANSNTNTFTVDTTPPAVTLSSTVANGGATSTSPVSFTATFNEPVTGFTSAGIVVSGGSVTSGLTAGSGNSYSFQLTPSGVSTVQVRVLGNAAQDQAGNNNTTSSIYSFTFATPTITVSPASLASGVQGQFYSQTFSASGGSGSYIYALSGTLPAGLSFSGSTLSGTPTASGSFTFRITATDNSAAPGPYSGFSNYTLTIAPPAVTVAPVLTSPANSSTINGTPTYAGTAPAGSTVTIYVATGSGAYQLVGTTTATGGSFSLVSPTALASGTYSAYATAQNSGATTSANSNNNTFTVDATAPTATIATTASSPTSSAPIPFTVTFSEPVSGFATNGITVTNGTIASAITNAGNAYSFSVQPTTNGVVTVNVFAGAAQDAVGNASTAATPLSVTYTTQTDWIGVISTDWFTAGNWSAGVPTATVDALVPAGTPFSPLIGANTAAAKNLTLASGATLTQSGGTLSLTGNLTNNGTFAATDGTVATTGRGIQTLGGSRPLPFQNLSIGANGAALATSATFQRALTLTGTLATNGQSLTLLSVLNKGLLQDGLVVNDGGVVVGTATVQRAIDPSVNPGLGYRHYTAPVSNSTVGDLVTSGFVPVVNPAYNTSPVPGSVSPYPTVFGYDDTRLATTATSNNLSSFDKGYFSPTALADPLAVGRGYTVNIAASEVVDFVGTLNNGTITLPLTSTRNTYPDGGWQLLGNPYPAPLDYSRVTAADRAGLESAIYVYSSTSQYTGRYRTYVNGIGNPVLPIGQGFFARVASGQTTATMTFRNSQRLAAPNGTAFQRTAADPRPLVQLELRAAASPTAADEFYAYAEAGATPSFDRQLDAVKLPNPTGFNLGGVAASGEPLAVDGRPAFTATTVLPLTVGVPTAGAYALSAASLTNLPIGLDAYLADDFTGQLTRLAAGTSYAFSVTTAQAAAPIAGRFRLLFRPATALATTASLSAADVSVFPNPARTRFTVVLPGLGQTTTVQAELLNALGQVVRRQTAALPASGTQFSFDTAELATGVYVLRLQAGTTTLAKRVVLE
jgi:sugar lactone lactonase YvrE